MPKRQEGGPLTSDNGSDGPNFGTKEIEFMPKLPSAAPMISPFGYTNGQRKSGVKRGMLRPGSDGEWKRPMAYFNMSKLTKSEGLPIPIPILAQ
jgi:hypothetical protein